ncbi:MAG: prolipoprotein diacylglyceryl transferase [Gammaproteobacteria bacterium]
MLQFPQIDPVAIYLGPLKIHWYALTYIAVFAAAWWLGTRRGLRENSGWSSTQVTDLITNSAIGVILGGRIGYMLFYNFGSLLENPVNLLKIWQGGMSFHGGLIGVGIAVWLFARSTKKSLFAVSDFVAPLSPLGLAFGRLGNFVNGELWGRASDVSWAMVFPADPQQLARHPSQLYQFALEGLALFCILWFFSAKTRPTFAVTGVFITGYGVFRTFAEFYREPDAHIGFVAFDWMTKGMQLSIPMIIGGLIILFLSYRKDTFGKMAAAN